MYRGHTISVVVPAYNEERFVGDVVRGLPETVDRAYVVDDGSTDETWSEIQSAADDVNGDSRDGGAHRAVRADGDDDSTVADRDDVVVPVRHPENRGVGGAIKTGYERALEDGMDVAVVMGGDGQMELSIFERLVDPIVDGEADYVKGNRFRSADELAKMPRFRRVGNRTLSLLTKIASGYWELGDPQSGYTAVSGDALEAVDVGELYEDYGYCNDLLVRLNVHHQRAVDVPRPVTYGDEESSIEYRTYIPRVSLLLLRDFLWRIFVRYVGTRDRRRVSLLYGASALGVVATLVAVVRSRDASRGGAASALLAVLSFVAAVVTDRSVNRHLNEQLDGE